MIMRIENAPYVKAVMGGNEYAIQIHPIIPVGITNIPAITILAQINTICSSRISDSKC